jgi:hypothetical protein
MRYVKPFVNLGCDMCDRGELLIFDPESLGTNPVHLVDNQHRAKCNAPDCAFEELQK